MLKRASLSCLFLLCIAVSASAMDKIAVLPFTVKGIEAHDINESFSSLLLNSIDHIRYFDVFERKKIENIVELEGLKMAGCTNDDLFRVGAKNGIDFLLMGSISRTGGTVTIEMELLSVRGRKICLSDTVTMSESQLSSKLPGVARKIVNGAKECFSTGGIGASDKSLEPPSGVTASGSPNSIRLKWSHPYPAHVVGYKIFRSGSESGPFTQRATTTESAFVDENLNLNEVFYYKVSAISKAGYDSGSSSAVIGKTSVAPPAPIFLKLVPDIKGAYLEWCAKPIGSRVQDMEEAGFKIYRKTAGERDFVEVASLAMVTSFTDSKLQDKIAYSYAIAAFNAGKTESELSSVLEVVTPQGLSGLKADSGKIRHVPLKWTPHSFEGVEGYRIYRAKEKEGEYKKVGQVSDRLTGSYSDSTKGIEDNATYWYKITAFNKSNAETDMSEPVSATTRGKPPVPSGMTAKSREARKVSLKWDMIKSPEDEIKGYRIYRAADEKGEYLKIYEQDSDRNTFVDDSTPLKDNTTYYYKISSYNSANSESLLSDPVSAITKNPPQVPSGVKAQSGEVKKVTLVWDKNPETDIKGYIIFRKKDGDKDFDKLTSVKAKTEYTDSGLKDGAEYTYAIQAVDKDNLLSAMSSPIVVKTKPLPVKPAGLRVDEKDGKKAISWDSNPEKDVKRYHVYKKGFLGSSKIASISAPFWIIQEIKGRADLFVTAEDESGLESESSDMVSVEIK